MKTRQALLTTQSLAHGLAIAVIGATIQLAPSPLLAQPPSSDLARLNAAITHLTQQLTDQQREISALRKELVALQSIKIEKSSAPETVPTNAQPPTAGSLQPPPPTRSNTPFIPEIGLVGDIVASSSQSNSDEEGNDRLSVREVELVISHDIDPYSRFDSTITFSDQEDPDIEEAYVTYWGLPLDLKARIGRMRPKIGKASATHRDSLDTVDEPFVVQSYFGPEGLFKTGLELSGFTPLPDGSLTQQYTLGVLEGGVGEEGSLFGDTRRHPSLYAHLTNTVDISDASSAELGATYLIGSSAPSETLDVGVLGVDATWIWKPDSIKRVKLQSEVFVQDRSHTSREDAEEELLETQSSPWGFYALADYRFSERWGLGGRYDWVEPTDVVDPSMYHTHDRALSAYLTFFQSEFARWRFQYQRAETTEQDKDNRLMLQGTFAIGTHKHAL